MIKRIEMIVYFNNRSDTAKNIEGLGATIQYFNKKMGYAILYLDESNLGKFISGIKRMKGFKRYEVTDNELVSFELEEPKKEEN